MSSNANFQKLHKQVMEFNDASDAIEKLSSRSDVEISILGPAYIDHGLKFAIKSKLVQSLTKGEHESLFEGDGPLSTFSGKTVMAHALGLLSKEVRRDLEKIRRIRNLFAHAAIPLSFDTGSVSDHCQHFHVFQHLDSEMIRLQGVTGSTVGNLKDEGGMEINGVWRSFREYRFMTDSSLRVLCYVPWQNTIPSTAKGRYVSAVQLCWFLAMLVGMGPYISAINEQRSMMRTN